MPDVPTFQGTPSLFNMGTWLHALGHSDKDLDRLNVIHVAGTKGKGSTCAFTRSFLEERGKRTGYPGKVGLYTSPHLKVVRERIQINSQLIRKDLFTKYLFEVWNKLEAEDNLHKPRYLQLLLIVAIHTFIREKVDVAVCETHHGGEYDATNVFPHPVATGITPIGMDHMAQLGPTIENISWHKSGIFKPGAPAFSLAQEDEVAKVLRNRATEKNVSLEFVEDDTLNNSDVLAIKPAVQRQNASLALKLANAFLLQKEPNRTTLTSDEIREGVQEFTWIGRFQQTNQGNHTWFLDGAHNEMSVPYTAQWFADVTRESSASGSIPRVLIFSHISERDGAAILKATAKTLQAHGVAVHQLIISTYEERLNGTREADDNLEIRSKPFPDVVQKQYVHAWREHQPDGQVSVEPTVEGALNLARTADRGEGVQTLITGSLYLVGSALRLLEPST